MSGDCCVTGRYSGGSCDLSQWCDRKSPRIHWCHARDVYISRLEKSGLSRLFLQEMNVLRSCLRTLYPVLAWQDTENSRHPHTFTCFCLLLNFEKYFFFTAESNKSLLHACMQFLNKKLRYGLIISVFLGF